MLDLEKLKALCAKATPGPWRYSHQCILRNGDSIAIMQFGHARDAEFIAAAREALPQLIEELEAARAEVEAYRAKIASFGLGMLSGMR